MKTQIRFKMSDSNGSRFYIYAESSADAIVKARRQSTANTIYIN